MKAILILILAAVPAIARIGETPEQCNARYGERVIEEPKVLGYSKAGFVIILNFHEGTAETIMVSKLKKTALGKSVVMSDTEISTVLSANGGNKKWEEIPDILDRHWSTEDGTMVAHYDFVENRLVVMTKECLDRSNAEIKAKEKANLEGF